MPNTKTGKPALAGLKPLAKTKGPGFDPGFLKAAKGPQGLKLVEAAPGEELAGIQAKTGVSIGGA